MVIRSIGPMDLEQAGRELYGLDLDDFVARRNELAKQVRREGDRALAARVGALRKPSISAWALNQLARSRDDDLARLEAIASTLRDAQDAGDAAALRERAKDGQRSVRSLVAATAEVAETRGRPLAPGAVAEVEQSLRDAMGDEDVLTAIRNGALVDAPRSAGLGAFGIDTGSASFGLAGGATVASRDQQADPNADERTRRRARDEAAARLESLRVDREQAEADLDALDHQLADLDDERARLVEQLEAVDVRHAAVGERHRRLEQRTARLAEELAVAVRALEELGGP
jgi:uncharacterized protein YhaN